MTDDEIIVNLTAMLIVVRDYLKQQPPSEESEWIMRELEVWIKHGRSRVNRVKS